MTQETEKSKFDMSRFKGTNMGAMKAKDEEVNKTVGIGGGQTRAGYHTLEEGANYFRIYPHHNAVREMIGEFDPKDLGTTFAENRVIYYVPMWVEDKDDRGNVKTDAKGKKLLKKIQKAVFDSRIHGDTPKDVCDEYIKYITKYATDNIKNEEERSKFLLAIEGKFELKIQGLKPKASWLVYADRITPKTRPGERPVYERKFAKLEFGKAVRIGVDKLSAQEEANQPLGTDPYTHPEEGLAITIQYTKGAKPNDVYGVFLYQPKLTANTFQLFPLGEVELTNLLSFPSLYKEYRNVYRRKDFEMALEGLKLFDQENNYNMINDPDFIEIIEEINSYYPIDAAEAEETSGEETEGGQEGAASDDGNDEADQFSLMDRNELKQFHKINKTGFMILPKHTDEEVRESAREFMKDAESEEQVVTKTPAAAQPKAEVKKETSSVEGKKETAKERVARLKLEKQNATK